MTTPTESSQAARLREIRERLTRGTERFNATDDVWWLLDRIEALEAERKLWRLAVRYLFHLESFGDLYYAAMDYVPSLVAGGGDTRIDGAIMLAEVDGADADDRWRRVRDALTGLDHGEIDPATNKVRHSQEANDG